MDEAAREVLRKLKPDIKKNLNLDDDILDTLEAGDTLTSDLVQRIKVEKTNSEKISLLLFMLQRRGPDAFQDFVDAISPASKFLADILLERYHEETQKLDRDSGNNSEESLEPTENAKPEVKEPVSPGRSNKHCLPHVSHTVNRGSENETVHCQHFSESHESHPTRRQSNHSLEFMIHPTNHFLHGSHASRRSSHSIDFATHQSLNGMYTKLKMHLFHLNEREQSFCNSPVPVTFEMVEDLLDKLLKLVHDCIRAIGATSKDSLLTNVINLKLAKTELQKNLNKKEEQIQKYAVKILKLETKCKNIETTFNQQQNTIESLRLENQRLKEENEKLREDFCQQTEEEISIKDKSFKQINRQNEELRKKVSKYEQELHFLSQKFSLLNKQAQDHKEEPRVMPNNVLETLHGKEKRKEVLVKTIVSEANDYVPSQPSTLQECRELCSGTSPRYNLKQMKNKILFAESKRPENKDIREATHHERVIANGTIADQKGEENDKRRQHLVSHSYENMSNLTGNKNSVLQSSLTKQKSPTPVRKPLTYKGLKRNPRWVRKPLR